MNCACLLSAIDKGVSPLLQHEMMLPMKNGCMVLFGMAKRFATGDNGAINTK